MKPALRVLVVEDSENDALLVLRELRKQGFDPVHERVDSSDALDKALDDERWDVILCDYAMPQFTALDALSMVQKRGLDAPFIVISGTIGEDVAVETMRLGAHDYLMKGNLQRLGEAIQREMKAACSRAETRLAARKIRHLNTVLRAIRNINQLIVREQDPRRLVEQACRELVSTRGYQTAWIGLTPEAPGGAWASESGWGDDFLPLAEMLESGDLPPCCQRSLETSGAMAIRDPGSLCSECPLVEKYRVTDSLPTSALAMSLKKNGKRYGFLCVSSPATPHVEEEELSLLTEVGGDIAVALHSMGLREERRHAEAALRESEWRYRDLIENMSELVQSVAPDGSFVFVNRAWMRTLGYTEEDIRGLSIFDIVHPDSQGHCREMFERVLKGGKVDGVEAKFLTKDRGTIVVEGGATCHFVEGRPTATHGIFRDVTERKQLRATMAQSDRLASMGMLAAGVAHEINNPLAYVLYNLESLSEDIPRLAEKMRHCRAALESRLGDEALGNLFGEDAGILAPLMFDDMAERFRDALNGSYRIRNIARGLGTFSRVERDELVPVNIHYTIECAASIASNEIKYRARLVKDLSPVPTVVASEGRLSQVFLNLLVNAAHAIAEGDVENNEIRVRTWREGDEVCVEVRDTGKGIPPENLEDIFEPFFTTKEVGVGSGLGLAISKSIIAGYGGRLEVKSELGKGTSFSIHLPIKEGEVASEEGPTGEAREEHHVRGRILVVDDEPAIRSAIKRMLEGHEVVEAGCGDEGRVVLKKDQSFDLILCDMMMPGVSGMDLHEWLSDTHPQLATRVVFITGGAFTPRAREYLTRVGNLRVEKPFDAVNFKKIVSELILAARSKG